MTADQLPTEEFLIFLNNDNQWRLDLGEHPSPDSDAQYQYVPPNPFQTAFRDVDGHIDLIPGPRGWEQAFGPFPSQLDGQKYTDVVNATRQAATK